MKDYSMLLSIFYLKAMFRKEGNECSEKKQFRSGLRRET